MATDAWPIVKPGLSSAAINNVEGACHGTDDVAPSPLTPAWSVIGRYYAQEDCKRRQRGQVIAQAECCRQRAGECLLLTRARALGCPSSRDKPAITPTAKCSKPPGGCRGASNGCRTSSNEKRPFGAAKPAVPTVNVQELQTSQGRLGSPWLQQTLEDCSAPSQSTPSHKMVVSQDWILLENTIKVWDKESVLPPTETEVGLLHHCDIPRGGLDLRQCEETSGRDQMWQIPSHVLSGLLLMCALHSMRPSKRLRPWNYGARLP
ncbi:hypothetical protein CCHR01_14339 [Colletotrichum chrysophilum]|uniref:Uncharacterized protein n=1 Tax=Colletotrichum chrysophilum TaxID=1836956 RepID=A0AAD9ACL8_9PEZI|nr:hypothetical protein CCHR01_14339 [Colletotrichum chrysophilum]